MGNKNKTKTNRVDALRCDKWFYSPTQDAKELATLGTASDEDRYDYDDYYGDTYYMEEFEWELYQLWYKLSRQKSGKEEQNIASSRVRWLREFTPEIAAELNELLVEMPLSDADFKYFCSGCSHFSPMLRDGADGGGNTRFNNLPARFGCMAVSTKASKQTQKGVTRHNRVAREASDSIDYPWFAKAVAKLRQDAHEEYESYLNSPDPTCKGEIRATDPFAPSYLEWRDERFEVGMDLLCTKLAREKRLAAPQSPAVSLTNQFDKLKSNNRI